MPEETRQKRRRKPDATAALWHLVPQCMQEDRVRIVRQLRRMKGGDGNGNRIKQLRSRAEQSAALLKRRRDNPLNVSYPEALPISSRKNEIVEAIRENPVVIVAGETGSGKTTQLPKMCLEAGRGVDARIACTQPRRVAAMSVSRRIAEELGVSWGKEVGCKIRFKDDTAAETRIKMMTDGMLLAEIQGDRDLYEYDTIIIDEAHERSLNIDFLLGYLRLLRKRRPELKLIITSATIDTEAFSKAFDDAPIIEVSGRMYPVEIRHTPMEDLLGEDDAYTYIDAAVAAVDAIVEEAPVRGDILVFMPTEKDIHETRRRLEGRRFRFTEVVPLFGRLTASDQQKVFHTQKYRRIVVATNIAETSITIPGIRFVVDTGLARMSRYNPRNQTHRLPVEPVSQSSAKQRAGRCGRVENGICIRLYDEKDFASRPEYTQPEIQRANLADVILQMISLRLGDPETFPFLDPPRPQAIQGGFGLLRELNAIDDNKRLTDIGKSMARLPIGPTVARMILEAEKEQALKEVVVIASALSIQDPRVRPLGFEKDADREHKRFENRESDFLALLNIWNAYHDQMEHMKTQNRARKFCKQHYLSFNRMREWRDIYTQIRQTLREIGGFRMNRKDAEYDAIHRSITSGLLSNVAEKKEGNLYRAARGRDVMLFPGSGLFHRKAEKGSSEKQETTPKWLVASEVVETSRLFARTAARVQPEWIAALGAHLCQASYKEPFYNARSGRVLVTETLTLYGLQVRQRRVDYGKIDAKAATEIFIREALVNDEVVLPHDFLEHNQTCRERVETWQMRQRQAQFLDVDEAVYRFYAARLENVSSIHDLNRVVRAQGQDHLKMSESDLTGGNEADFDTDAFPATLEVGGESVQLTYAYRPGQDGDGVTLKLPHKLVDFVQPEVLEWLVPGLLEEKVTHLLRGLPKGIRRQFVPVPDKAREIARSLRPTHGSFIDSLTAFIADRYKIDLSPADWRTDDMPEHLRMRVEVQDDKNAPVVAARDLDSLRDRLDQNREDAASSAWQEAAAGVERDDVTGEDLDGIPDRVEVAQAAGMPVYGTVGLQPEGEKVAVRLFSRPDAAEASTRDGWVRLCERELRDEMKALKRSLDGLKQVKDLAHFEGGSAAVRDAAYENLAAFLFDQDAAFPIDRAGLERRVADARDRMRHAVPNLLESVTSVFETYRELRLMPESYPGMKRDLKRLMPPDFLARTPLTRLPDLNRYLKAAKLRAERAALDPRKDKQKAEQVEPFQAALDDELSGDMSQAKRAAVAEFRWLLEELRVSVFAQELGTAQKVSAKRLADRLEEIRGMK